MKNYYKDYEQMINDLIFDGKYLIIKNERVALKYV